MMKNLVLAIAMAAAAASSQAQMYVQGNLGSVHADAAGAGTGTSSSLGLGLGYKLNNHFAVDGSYNNLYKETDLKSNAVFVRAIGIYPINDSISLNAKIGLGQFAVNISNPTDKAKGSLTYGIGAEYALSKQWALGLDIDAYKSKATTSIPTIKQTNIAFVLKYNF